MEETKKLTPSETPRIEHKAMSDFESYIAKSKLRWPILIVLLGGGSGAGYVWGGAGTAATEQDLEHLSEKMEERDRDLENQIRDLQPLIKVSEEAYEMSALALEISVESHRYTADLVVDIARLDHPEYKPPSTSTRLVRRLRQGSNLLDELDSPPTPRKD